MEILNWNKLIVIPLLLIFYGCGQQTMKDEGLETKSINEAGTSTPTFRNLKAFKCSSKWSSILLIFHFTLILERTITDYFATIY